VKIPSQPPRGNRAFDRIESRTTAAEPATVKSDRAHDLRRDLIRRIRRDRTLFGINRWDEKTSLRRDAIRPQVIDTLEAQRLARIDPGLLVPVQHSSQKARADLTVIRAGWDWCVRARTCTDQHGSRIDKVVSRAAEAELQSALQPLLEEIESLSERIREYNERVQQIAQESYPEVARLEQVKGVGTLISLTYVLTLEDPRRFRKSRDVGCYLGLRPGRRNSGQSEPQLHISKEGDPYLRTLLVQGAHHILGPFGADSDLRRWGLRLAGVEALP